MNHELTNHELSRCVRCGTCRSVCPTFGVIQRETASARGKVSLVDALVKGDLEPSDRFVKHITECVLCEACQEVCPNEVRVPDIILAARREVVRKRGMSFVERFFLHRFLGSDRLMPMALKLASRMQGVFFKKIPDDSGLLRRFPLPLIGEGRLVPPLAEGSFLEGINGSRFTIHGSRPRIGFFVGCLINYILPHIGEASLKVLERVGAEVIVPLDQRCCGMPALGFGDVETARHLALKNLEVFEGYNLDYITTACATCGEGLKKWFKELLSDEPGEVQTRVEAFCSKVRDITELLVNELDGRRWLLDGSDYSPQSTVHRPVVTYHDPCHLSRGQGVKDEPRELLESVSNITFKEMNNPCRCCGLGGSLNITHYDLSMEINKRKSEDIKGTGAEIVATACPGCIIQLKDGLHRLGVKARVVHVVELLAQ